MSLRYNNPELLEQLLEKLTLFLIDYCIDQIEAGAEAIQIFDTWLSILDSEGAQLHVFPHLKRLVSALKMKYPEIPLIYFSKKTAHWLKNIIKIGIDVISIDTCITLADAKKITGPQVALQGNLDPIILLSSPEIVKKMSLAMLNTLDNHTGYIANLGHGVLPQTPQENIANFISTVQQYNPL